MVVVFKMAVLPANFRKWKLSFLQSVPKYANCIDPKRHMTFHSRNIELSVKYFLIWAYFVGKWLIGDHFIQEKKNRSSQKNITFVFDRKFRHFPDLPVLSDFVCIEPKGLPTTYQKISIVTKWGFFVTKFVMGGLGPKKFSTFGPSDASRKKTIKFHLMQAIAFYSPCFCLSNRVWHEQIVLCTIVKDPNNFKCHGTIFAIFWHQKTHYFLERTHQNLTHRMHDATHWIYPQWFHRVKFVVKYCCTTAVGSAYKLIYDVRAAHR